MGRRRRKKPSQRKDYDYNLFLQLLDNSNRTKKVNMDFLEHRTKKTISRGYLKPKWIQFCEEMVGYGLEVFLYEAKRTRSKYVRVVDGKYQYRIRFSDHKPILQRELENDCDFFVGKTNLRTTNTDMAIDATLNHFNQEHGKLIYKR